MVELAPGRAEQHEVDEWLGRQRRLSQEMRPELVQKALGASPLGAYMPAEVRI